MFSINVTAAILITALSAATEAAPRFKIDGPSIEGTVDWLAMDRDRIVAGSGKRLWFADHQIQLDAPASSAALVDDQLYLTRPDGLVMLRLDSLSAAPTPIALDPTPRRQLLVTRMPDHLVVAEDGLGLRLLALPPPVGMQATHHHHHQATKPRQVASFEMQHDITALGSSANIVYATTTNRELIAIDARDPSDPVETLRMQLAREVRSIAANGSRLYLLDTAGLTVIDVSDTHAPVIEGVYPEVHGRAIHVAGRSLYVGQQTGVVRLRDQSPLATTHLVTVGDFFFGPANLSIDAGDTVQWDWNAVFSHNVDSCDGNVPLAANSYCNAQPLAAEGTFTSGAPTASPATFSKTFSAPGPNPYFCVLHVTGTPSFGMVGSVTVNATATPPGVPDSAPGMRISKLDANADALRLIWDDDVCTGDCGHHIVHGVASGLPGFTLTSSPNQCGIGASPYLWSEVPDPSPEPFLWFLVVADDCATTEGSWGQDNTGDERNGAAASGQCGITDKDLQNVCGQ